MCLFLNGVAGFEDYKKALLSARPPLVPAELRVQHEGPFVEITNMESANRSFNNVTGIRGSGESMTFGHLHDIMQRPLLWYEQQFVNNNVGYDQWAVSSVLLFWSAIPYELLRVVFLESGLHQVHLTEWAGVVKEWLVLLKRCPRIDGCDATPEQVLMLRKLLNICSRSEKRLDWEADDDAHTLNTQVHFTLTRTWQCDREGYVPAITTLLRSFLPDVIAGTVSDSDISPVEEWWSKRAQWAPGGSSSDRSPGDGLFADKRLRSGDRANKKTIFSELPDSYAREAERVVPRSIARGSGKHEPGDKDRCLWAIDDLQFVVAAYASHNLEKFVNNDGIRAKQMPSDVMDWVSKSFCSCAPARWLSLDYSDYNKEHETPILCTLNVELANAWLQAPLDLDIVVDKASYALWQADSHANKYAVGPELPAYRVFGGLFSGCRDTARDHALLHWAYSTHARNMCRFVDPSFDLLNKYFTGDDEDTEVRQWADALLYLIAHMLVGHTIKAQKQICSLEFHEYLQRLVGTSTAPTRPICTSIGTLVSGQWYHDTHKWFDNIIQSISDNLWDAHARGLPLTMARRWAAAYIGRQMRVEMPDGTFKPLEWWAYRHGTAEWHPLWYGTTGEVLPLPSIDAKVAPLYGNQFGIKALVQFRRRQMPNLPFSEENYSRLLSPEVYSSVYASVRADNHTRFAQISWPIRYSTPDLTTTGLVRWATPDWLVNELKNFPDTDRRPATLDEVYGRMGLDAVFVAAAGGLQKVLCYLPPAKLAKFVLPVEKCVIPLWLRKTDPAVQSVLANMGVGQIPNRPIPMGRYRRLSRLMAPLILPKALPHGLGTETPLLIIMAPNGAGKSTFSDKAFGIMDFDKIFSTTFAQKSVHTTSKHEFVKTTAVIQVLEEVLSNTTLVGITTQYPVYHYLRVLHVNRPLSFVVVEPPMATLRARLLSRGWSQEMVERRLERWTLIKRAVSTKERTQGAIGNNILGDYRQFESFDDLLE